VRALFHAFALLDHEEDAQRARTIDELCDLLAMHARLEDELFYPALRGAVDDGLLEDAVLEHDSTGELVEQLGALFPDDDWFDVTVAVLAEEVERHVAFEENLLFPALARSSIDQQALGLHMHARRARLEADLAAPPSAIDGSEPRGLLRGASGRLRERRARPR
jgi:iron-sulfur cluster repair protein YtfE (RIC family)